MPELNIKSVLTILSCLENLEDQADKLYKLLPDSLIEDAPLKGARTLRNIKDIAADLHCSIHAASGAVLHLRETLDDMEAKKTEAGMLEFANQEIKKVIGKKERCFPNES